MGNTKSAMWALLSHSTARGEARAEGYFMDLARLAFSGLLVKDLGVLRLEFLATTLVTRDLPTADLLHKHFARAPLAIVKHWRQSLLH